MNILHYSLGFPPYRSGGLTKFSMDLMKAQIASGNVVGLLWPGEIQLFRNKTRIRESRAKEGIISFEVVNPTPISFDEGIVDVSPFMSEGDIKVYEDLLDRFKPHVIHIHTFMGLHKALVLAAHKKKIRVVFSAHDFFPICPKVTMFRNGTVCDTVNGCELCESCNQTALPKWKMIVLQLPLYRIMKNTSFIKKMRKQHRDNYLSESVQSNSVLKSGNPSEYLRLRNHYQSMFDYIDSVHFNSTITAQVYKQYLNIKDSCIIPISHENIENNLKEKKFGDMLRVTYLGPQSTGKGYYLLKETLDILWEKKKQFVLNVFFEPVQHEPYIVAHERYSYDQLEAIFEETDVLIVPSILYETFGYTALEALSYGVPVIISDKVGAKDIIPHDGGIVINDISPVKLVEELNALTRERLANMNDVLVRTLNVVTMDNVVSELLEKCYQ